MKTFLILRRAAKTACLVAAFVASSSLVNAQTVLEVDFDQYNSNSTYTLNRIDNDFGEIDFDNGVPEGRARIVTGSEAYNNGTSLAIDYPTGGTGAGPSGAQWLVELPVESDEAYLSYRVKFKSGFDFVRGGKLPGLAGGSAPSGSAPADGVRGWTGRMMWLTDNFQGTPGQPEQVTTNGIAYTKHIRSGFDQDGRQEDEELWFDKDGALTTMRSGVWYSIRQRVRMNTIGNADGILQIWLDGQLVHEEFDLEYRTTANLSIDRLFFSTFFGGGSGWEASKPETAFFDDFKLSFPTEIRVPEDQPNVAAAVNASNPGDTILLGAADWYANLQINHPLTLRGRGPSKLFGARGDRPVVSVFSDNVTIEQMEINRGGGGVVATAGANQLTIRDCGFNGNFGDAIRVTDCNDIEIARNNLNGNWGRGIYLDRVEEFSIGSCDVVDSGGAGLELLSINNGAVTGCQATRSQAGAGYFIIGTNFYMADNDAQDNIGMGFLLVSCDSFGFRNNLSTGNTSFGILGYATNNAEYAFNEVTNNQGVGAILDNSSGVFFHNNQIDNNSGIGMYLAPSTSNNYMLDNEFSGNAFSLGIIDEGNGNFISP